MASSPGRPAAARTAERRDVQVHTRAEVEDVYALLRDGAIRIFRKGRVTGRDQVVEMIPGRRFAYRHLSGLPVRDYRGDVGLEPTEQETRIGWHILFRPVIFGTGWLLRWAIKRFARRCADGLAGYAQTTATREC